MIAQATLKLFNFPKRMHKRHLQHLSADKVVDSEFKLSLARAANFVAFCFVRLLRFIILTTDTS